MTNQQLIEQFEASAHKLSYARIENGRYLGWMSDLGLVNPSGNRIGLDPVNETDKFLLIICAIAWSRPGPWENAVYLTAFLKEFDLFDVKAWRKDCFVQLQAVNRKKNSLMAREYFQGINPRKAISYRKDVFKSIQILAKNWSELNERIDEASKTGDFYAFAFYLRSIEGLGAGKNKMMIKIPLILRELRCSGLYPNIPGELCCIPDKRVVDAAKELGFSLSRNSSLENVFRSSKMIYRVFGDYYDIPLFSYNDIKGELF